MIDQKTVGRIKSALAQGRTREDIYKELLNGGWKVDDIQENFSALNQAAEAEKEKERHSQRTIHIIVTIGAILIGAGIFSFIAANWEYLGRPFKVGLILFFMIFSYASGWYLKEKRKLLKTGEALILLGAIIYGSGIFLVAQMFNIQANWPDGFILWMAGAMALGFALDSYPLLYLAIPLGVVPLIGHPFMIFAAFGSEPFLLTSSFLLLAAAAATFAAGLLIKKKIPPELKDFY